MRKIIDTVPFVAIGIFFIGILGILLSYVGQSIGMSLNPDSTRAVSIKIAGVGLAGYVVLHFLLPSSAKR